jgi:hypothetical protein
LQQLLPLWVLPPAKVSERCAETMRDSIAALIFMKAGHAPEIGGCVEIAALVWITE